MRREEFMAQLARLLTGLPENEREEAVRYYNDYFDEAGPENEAQVIQELGSPGKVAGIIRANLEDGQNRGEFTENGYRDSAGERKPSYPSTERVQNGNNSGSQRRRDSWYSRLRNGGAATGDGQEDSVWGAGTQNTADRTEDAQSRERQNRDGMDNASRTRDKNTADPGGNGWSGSTHNTDNGSERGWNGTSGFSGEQRDQAGDSGQGQTPPPGGTRYYGPEAPQRRRGAGGWALLIILAVFALPVILGLGGGLLGGVLGLLGGLLGLILACVFGGGGLLVGGIILFVKGLIQLIHSPASAMISMGGGLIFTALGLLFLLLFIWLAFRLIPRVARAVLNFISRIAHRGRGGDGK